MRNIRLYIAYDGTDFSGWQRQENTAKPTIQGEIEQALEKIHKHPVSITGSGRTDAGVHAFSQCANFYTDIASMEAGRFVPALNSLLPRDIRIMESQEVHFGFHARLDTRSRMYRYYFVQAHKVLPMELRFANVLWRQPDIVLLNEYCRFFRGEFDCTVFASPADKSVSRYRYIYSAGFFIEGTKIVFEIKANAFLWKMIRSIVGTLLFYEEKKICPEDFLHIISSGKRELAGPTLSPQGLFLWNVEY